MDSLLNILDRRQLLFQIIYFIKNNYIMPPRNLCNNLLHKFPFRDNLTLRLILAHEQANRDCAL